MLTATSWLSPLLVAERLKLQARALIDLGRQREALEILKDDKSREADLSEMRSSGRPRNGRRICSKVFIRSTSCARQTFDERKPYLSLIWAALALAGYDKGSAKHWLIMDPPWTIRR